MAKINKLKSGCELIDKVLYGGLPRNQLIGIHGNFNIGKTILNFQYAFSFLEQEPGRHAIIINTEPQSLELEHFSFFIKRFGIDEGRLKIINANSLSALFDFFGYDLSYTFSEEGKISIALKNKYTLKKNEKRREEIFADVSFLSIDSLSTPFKQLMLNETKNLAARSSLIYFLFGQLQLLVNRYNLFCILINHTSYNPIKPFDTGKISGGAAIQYNLKFIFRILNGSSAKRKKYGDEAKRIKIDRMPFVKISNDSYDVMLKKDFGFCDYPSSEEVENEEEAKAETDEEQEEIFHS